MALKDTCVDDKDGQNLAIGWNTFVMCTGAEGKGLFHCFSGTSQFPLSQQHLLNRAHRNILYFLFYGQNQEVMKYWGGREGKINFS